MITTIATSIGWVFIVFFGLVALLLFVRYVLPVVLMLAIIGGALFVGYAVYARSASDVAAVQAPAVPHVTTPRPAAHITPAAARPHPRRANPDAVQVDAAFCARHPNAVLCEDRD
jgi:hypothetical protein